MQTDGRKLIVANWKSHKTLAECKSWLSVVGPEAKKSPYTIIVCPPAHLLLAAQYEIQSKKYSIILSAQDVSMFPMGSYTGAITAQQLAGVGVTYVIVGHSERRRYFHETYQDVANKIDLAISEKIIPIVCLRKEDITQQAAAIDEKQYRSIIVLYETVGHIGTGEVEAMDSVMESVGLIQKAFGDQTPILYGGSISSETKKEFLERSSISGVVVGTDSLDPRVFLSLIAG